MNKQQLASKIWESANKMRSKIEANEYKDYILGFIFYKFLSDKEVKFLKENDFTKEDIEMISEDDQETVRYVQERIGYFISYENLFSTWIDPSTDFDVANVRDALSAFSRLIDKNYKKVFDKIFQTLETGLSKLGSSAKEQTKAISDLLQLIKDIPMDGKQDYDVLGFIYEYLISNFAANAGKKAGEFYTPHEVSLLMSEIVAEHLKDRKEIKIYDPTSGSGSLLINIGKSVSKFMNSDDNIKYYAQELKENTYNLTRMNLVMRGILPANISVRNGDTLEEDWPYFDEANPVETYDPLYVDAVVSNPPYSQKWDPSRKESEPRYANYGLAPKGKADYAFLLHDLYHVKPDGIMAIVLPHGVLFRGGEEGTIRKNLIEKNNIDTIIGLPANIFFGTGIPTIIMVLKQKRDNTDVLIIDASKGFVKEGKNNKLRACDIKKITDAIKDRKNIEKFCRVVSRDEIRANEYNLNIPRYVDSSEKAESWDIYASMFGGVPEKELSDLNHYWDAFPSLKNDLFKQVNDSYWEVNSDDVKATVRNNSDVKNFVAGYKNSFSGFDKFLKDYLIDQMDTINISKGETSISENIFLRLKGVPLVDKYEAYQILDTEWTKTAIDLEIIQTEGREAIRQVDPNMVIKKKDSKEIEVQDGWVGHVIPFELIQSTILKVQKDELQNKENRLSKISSEVEELIDSLNEEEKEMDFFDSDKNAFVNDAVKKAMKDKDTEVEIKKILKAYTSLTTEEKALKKEIKEDNETLQMETKKCIETLNDDQVIELLTEKWINTLVDSLNKLPEVIISSFVKSVEHLCKKYETTYDQIEKEIQNTEASLIEMIDELEGDTYDMLGLTELKELLSGK